MRPRLQLARGHGGPPAHLQITDQLGEAIANGKLAPGDRLPPERELAAELGVSRMTVRQALGALESQGLLVRAQGRGGGTFVARPKLERDLGTFSGLSEELRRQGVRAGARVLHSRQRVASTTVAAALELQRSEHVVEIERVRLADGEPFAIERSCFPAHRFADLLGLDLEGSLYELLAEHWDAAPVRAVERLEPVLATEAEADALGVPRGAPLMLVERIAYDAAGAPVEFARDRFRGDRTRIVAWTSELVQR
ncbi:MAG TPA: GntR family transcriptional regulator [Gaiellaceae bacterium]|nr:GntR family transcriptional regulator [Gaiellaceae bacterium]